MMLQSSCPQYCILQTRENNGKEKQSFLFSRDITVQVGTGRDKSHTQSCFDIPEEEHFTSSLCARRMSQNNKLAIIIVKGLSWLGLGKNC